MFKFFNKETQKEEKFSPKVTESQKILKDYFSTKEEIEYLDGKYDDFIFSSLNADFDENKKYVDVHYPMLRINSHWSITDMKYSSEFTLSKKNSDEYGDKVKINVTYSFDNEVWKLKSINLEIGYHSNIVLSVDKFSDIIFQYFIYLKFKEIQKLKQSKSETFQKMINVIGKDVKRDAIIDQILS